MTQPDPIAEDHAGPVPRTRSIRQVIRWFLRGAVLSLGLVALAWFVQRTNWSETRELAFRLGWSIPLLLLPYFCVYIVDCWGWILSFARRPPLRFATLFRIRWAGEAINSVIPSAYIGGEAAKVLILRRKGVPGGDAVAAAVLSKTLQTLSQLVFLAIAAVAFLSLGTVSAGFAGSIVVLLILGTAGIVGGILWQRRGLFGTAADIVRLLGGGGSRLEKRLREHRATDEQISGFHREHGSKFYASAGAYLAGWFLDTVEIFAFTWFLSEPVLWRQALAIEAFTGIAKAFSVVIPGAIGVQESGIVFLCRMAGVPESLGITYALFRRAREILFAILGWKLLLLEQVRVRDLAQTKSDKL